MKRKTIKILGIFGVMAVGIMGTSPVKAIPVVVDPFNAEHDFSATDTSTPKTDQPTGLDIIGGERDVHLDVNNVSGFQGAVTRAGQVTQGGNLFLSNFTGSTVSTLSLTYDGSDGSADPRPNTTPGGGFDTDGLNSGLGIDVTDGGINNVFTIEGFNSDSDLVNLTIELYDAHGEMRDVNFDFRTPTEIDFTIALTEAVILGGVDTTDDNVGSDTSDNLFFESNSANTNFDFTQVTAVKFQSIVGGQSNYSAEGLRFERIPFEAESSIGIALLGAWGIWKRWKKQGEETAEESNFS